MNENSGHWLSAKEVEFLEDAMRKNGDFGVYGSVQDGLRSLVTHMEVSMKEDDENWEVSAYPRDDHGHFLEFPINKVTGEIDDVAAGHLEPEPEDFVDELPKSMVGKILRREVKQRYSDRES